MLKAIPIGMNGLSGARIQYVDFFKCIAHAAIVARRTSDDEIAQIVIASSGVGYDMVVLSPNCLKGCMLRIVCSAPYCQVRVRRHKPLADFFSHDGYAAKSAVIAISLV